MTQTPLDPNSLIFSLDVYASEEGMPVAVAYNDKINKQLLERGLSVERLLPEVLFGFLMTFCEERSIRLDTLIKNQLAKRQVANAIKKPRKG